MTHPPLSPKIRTEDPDNVLAPAVGPYRAHLEGGRFKAAVTRVYVATVLHFGDWLRTEEFSAADISEATVQRFLLDHLPRCQCMRPIPRGFATSRAALNHLLSVLRWEAVIGQPNPGPFADELTQFDSCMANIWGLSQGTRDHRCRIIKRLLTQSFPSGQVDLSALSPTIIRDFVLGEESWKTSTIRVMAGAVRCYLRHRLLSGGDVAHLLRAVPRPAFWRDATLPEAISDAELAQLLGAFKQCNSPRRAYAIVRCLVDLGLRSTEVIRLRLDEIDWQAGTITIAAGKTRRADILPLPEATGAAIADYLFNERPTTARREVFVRIKAPVGEPVGRRAVQRTLHEAYKRLGWSHTRVHILRHTLGRRLINTGTPLKQIADLLRHRSIISSATYTRVDDAGLSSVALPWPEGAA
jgi:integrase/recombinase XerD